MPKQPVIKATNGGNRSAKRKPKRAPARSIGGGGRRVQPTRGKRRSGR